VSASESGTRGAALRDARDLRRGVGVNAIGYAFKLANPVLLALLTNAYGPETFGAFTIAQASILLAVRFGALGLDKALLWWVPRQPPSERRRGVRSVLALAASLNFVVALVIFGLADPRVLAWLGQPEDLSLPLRIMALATVPQVCTDVLSHASMGLRRMEAQVLVKDALVPVGFPLLAVVLFYAFDATHLGMPIAFVIANVLGFFVAIRIFARLFAGTPVPADDPKRPPAELIRYAVPMWLAEMTNSLLQRLDLYMVTALTGDLALVGIYEIARRFGEAIRMIRRSFDPIVVAIVAEIGATGDLVRLRAGYSYATFLVTLTQLPIFAAIFAFAREIAPLYGEGFEAAAVPIVIFGVTWLVNGLFSLAGIVVSAWGLSKQTLLNMVFAVVVLGVAGMLLIPPFGLEGAASSVGIAYVLQALLQLWQMRRATGGWNYNRTVLYPLGLGALAGLSMAAVWLGLVAVAPSLPRLAVEIAAFVAFAAVYGAGVLRLRARGLLGRPRIA
jgi:O-antigen/teichoic acid export membrane protein